MAPWPDTTELCLHLRATNWRIYSGQNFLSIPCLYSAHSLLESEMRLRFGLELELEECLLFLPCEGWSPTFPIIFL